MDSHTSSRASSELDSGRTDWCPGLDVVMTSGLHRSRHLTRCPRSRKTLIYLILTLNHIYPDYDFSLLRAHHFRKELGVKALEESVDSHLLEVSRVRAPLETNPTPTLYPNISFRKTTPRRPRRASTCTC